MISKNAGLIMIVPGFFYNVNFMSYSYLCQQHAKDHISNCNSNHMVTSCVQKLNMFKTVLVDSQTCCEYCTIRFKH